MSLSINVFSKSICDKIREGTSISKKILEENSSRNVEVNWSPIRVGQNVVCKYVSIKKNLIWDTMFLG